VETFSTPARHFDRIRPLSLGMTNPATQVYMYNTTIDEFRKLTMIADQAASPNSITLNRDTTGLVRVFTSSGGVADGRCWDIQYDANGYITGVIPYDSVCSGSNTGARYFSWSAQFPDGKRRVTEVRDATNVNVLYAFTYDTNGDLASEQRYIDGEGLVTAVTHQADVSPNQENRIRREYTAAGVYRQFYFAYDSANNFKHRLASITAYLNTGGTGTAYTTTFTHDTGNSAGTVTLTQVDLPDGTNITHEYDSHVGTETGLKFGLRTKTIHHGFDADLVTYDAAYEFFYLAGCTSGATRLFYLPRIVKMRDGRNGEVVLCAGVPSDPLNTEVTFDYENGGTGCGGERRNRLLSKIGPTINLGTSGQRTPQTAYSYDPNNYKLISEQTYYAGGAFRTVAYEYDALLRLKKQTVDPGTPPAQVNSVTEYQYVDNLATQDRITIDPDGYVTRTGFDNQGRVATVKRFLPQNLCSGVMPPCLPTSALFYQTTNVYDINGRLFQQIVDNKDQDGTSLTPVTITTRFVYDRLGRQTQRVVDDGGINQQFNTTYNWLGQIKREYDTSTRGRELTYEGRGMLKSETPLDSANQPVTSLTVTYDYTANGQLKRTNLPTGVKIENTTIDDFGRVTLVKRIPTGTTTNTTLTSFEYDDANNVTRTYVQEMVPNDGSQDVSDATACFDEGGFNYESRQRTVGGVDNNVTAAPQVFADPLTTRKFDWAGNVTEEKSLGETVADRVITTVYDGANRVMLVTNSEGGETTYFRDARGNVTQEKVKLNTIPEYALTDTIYDALSRATRITMPDDANNCRHYRDRAYDSRGNLRRETLRDASNNAAKMTTLTAYDNAGRQNQTAVLATAANYADPPNAVSDRVIDFLYDADGRLLFRKTYNANSATPLTTSTTYDAVGHVLRVTDPSGSYTEDTYAANGRLDHRIVSDGMGLRTFNFAYDGLDRVKSQTAVGPPDIRTDYAYDALDRQTDVTADAGGTPVRTATTFDLVGRRTILTEDAMGPNGVGGQNQRRTFFAYNRASQLVTQSFENLNPRPSNSLIGLQTTQFRYDSLGRTLRIVYPDSSALPDDVNCIDCVRMQYDLAGRLTQRIDQRGTTTTSQYDKRGLLLFRRTPADGSMAQDSYQYDAVARVTSAQRGTGSAPDAVSTSTTLYNDLGDLTQETQKITSGGTQRTVVYTYDQAGNRTSATYPGSTALTYTPTALNQVDQIKLGGVTLADYGYTGRLLTSRQIVTNNQTNQTTYDFLLGYDNHRRINGVTDDVSVVPGMGLPYVNVIAQYTFTYDNRGNPLSQTADTHAYPGFSADTRSYTYDRLNRLLSTTYAETGSTETAVLDRAGNRQTYTSRDGEVIGYTLANPANEYGAINGHPLTYDPAGNLILDEDGRHYFYDEQNRLTQVQKADSTVLANYTYDALGRRMTFQDAVAGTTTRYYYDGQAVIEERNGACPGANCDALLRHHIHGGQYVDEHLATFTVATNAYTYYLHNRPCTMTPITTTTLICATLRTFRTASARLVRAA
jgi:YD repeat-containing protein